MTWEVRQVEAHSDDQKQALVDGWEPFGVIVWPALIDRASDGTPIYDYPVLMWLRRTKS